MTNNIVVTVAPFSGVPISPHPSGLSQLGSLTLLPGDQLRVTRAEADQLYRDGRILHPVTGQPRPEETRERGKVAFMDGDGRVLSAQPSWPQQAEYSSELPARDDPPPPPRHPSRGE